MCGLALARPTRCRNAARCWETPLLRVKNRPATRQQRVLRCAIGRSAAARRTPASHPANAPHPRRPPRPHATPFSTRVPRSPDARCTTGKSPHRPQRAEDDPAQTVRRSTPREGCSRPPPRAPPPPPIGRSPALPIEAQPASPISPSIAPPRDTDDRIVAHARPVTHSSWSGGRGTRKNIGARSAILRN